MDPLQVVPLGSVNIPKWQTIGTFLATWATVATIFGGMLMFIVRRAEKKLVKAGTQFVETVLERHITSLEKRAMEVFADMVVKMVTPTADEIRKLNTTHKTVIDERAAQRTEIAELKLLGGGRRATDHLAMEAGT